MMGSKLALLLAAVLTFVSSGGSAADPSFNDGCAPGDIIGSAALEEENAGNENNENKEKSGNEAVYLGIRNYGRNNISSASDFGYRFYDRSGVETYNIGLDGAYTIQNRLEEGHIYTLRRDGNYITDLNEAVPDARGVITDASYTAFIVGDRRFLITEDTAVYCILNNAGGSDVVRGEIHAGDTVEVYGEDTDSTDGDWIALSVYNIQRQSAYEPPVKAVSGLRTIKNLLKTGTQPIGTTLYVYGGGWNWQDNGGNILTSSVGIPQSWVDFFNSHDADYQFYTTNSSGSYYPYGGYNEYNRSGLDCSGFISWTLYNTLNSGSGLRSYVSKSTGYALRLADEFGYGAYYSSNSASDFKPGDIMSIEGHVWLCAGVCGDGSIVIMHSTPGESVTGCRGGGPQLSAVGSQQSEAYALASKYMKRFYPEWSSRYKVMAFSHSRYIQSGGTAGRFSWDIENGPLTDPDGYRNMSAEEILRDIYGE